MCSPHPLLVFLSSVLPLSLPPHAPRLSLRRVIAPAPGELASHEETKRGEQDLFATESPDQDKNWKNLSGALPSLYSRETEAPGGCCH